MKGERQMSLRALKAADFAAAKVKTKKLGGYVYFKQLSVAEHSALVTKDGKTELGSLLRLGLCDEAGQPIFNDENIKTLLEVNLTLATRIFSEWQEFNGFDYKAVENAEKN
jgi:hypothetical protein